MYIMSLDSFIKRIMSLDGYPQHKGKEKVEPINSLGRGEEKGQRAIDISTPLYWYFEVTAGTRT